MLTFSNLKVHTLINTLKSHDHAWKSVGGALSFPSGRRLQSFLKEAMKEALTDGTFISRCGWLCRHEVTCWRWGICSSCLCKFPPDWTPSSLIWSWEHHNETSVPPKHPSEPSRTSYLWQTAVLYVFSPFGFGQSHRCERRLSWRCPPYSDLRYSFSQLENHTENKCPRMKSWIWLMWNKYEI